MITGELKSQVDRVWDAFWTGGISNPLTVIEQITYLLFIRRLDELQTHEEKKANIAGIAMKKSYYTDDQQDLRWSRFRDREPEEMFRLFTMPEGVFDFMKNIGEQGSIFGAQMKGATFMIPTPRVLDQVVQMIDAIPMDNRDTKGDLYEYLLSKIASAGQNGQFRTPRHIIKMMVDMVEPQPDDTVCDPSCGTAGFLVAVGEYFYDDKRKALWNDQSFRKHFAEDMFHGLEFDSTMVRIAAMNLYLHGIENPELISKDALSERTAHIVEEYSLVLANPPFKGSLDYDQVDKNLLSVVKTKKTELLFLAQILRILKKGGRAAVIVPQGVQFGSSNAHKALRRELVENQKLEAVISMPSGVFKPYAGVSTAILIFTKTDAGGTDKVWFYDMHADGLSLDDKRSEIEANDIPDIIARWKDLTNENHRARTDQSFFVPKTELKENDWDLSINRYKEVEYEEVDYEKPEIIIEQIKTLDRERGKTLEKLESLLQS
jgi:type I restriction enzyme M protein